RHPARGRAGGGGWRTGGPSGVGGRRGGGCRRLGGITPVGRAQGPERGRQRTPNRAGPPRGGRRRPGSAHGAGGRRARHRAPLGTVGDAGRRLLREDRAGDTVSALTAIRGIVTRDLQRTSRQSGRLLGGLVRPFMWLLLVGTGYNAIARVESGIP